MQPITLVLVTLMACATVMQAVPWKLIFAGMQRNSPAYKKLRSTVSEKVKDSIKAITNNVAKGAKAMGNIFPAITDEEFFHLTIAEAAGPH